jgi:hypothetical protein
VARHFHRRLAEVAEFFRHRQRSYHFYASSLLFVYDYDVVNRMMLAEPSFAVGHPEEAHSAHGPLETGHFAVGHSEEAHSAVQPDRKSLEMESHVRLKLIDFAHVFPAATTNNPDDNFLFGVENLRDIFRDFLHQNGKKDVA